MSNNKILTTEDEVSIRNIDQRVKNPWKWIRMEKSVEVDPKEILKTATSCTGSSITILANDYFFDVSMD